MSTPITLTKTEQEALANARRGLKLVSVNLPHLAGLAHTVRLRVSRQYPVAAVGASGLLVVNPDVFARTPTPDLVFVLAHELLHLALDTFGRRGQSDPYLANVAHDWIINDILAAELGRPAPLGGLVREGARHESLEALVSRLTGEDGEEAPGGCWAPAAAGGQGGSSARRDRDRLPPGKSAIQEQLERLGLVAPPPEAPAEKAPDEGPPGESPPGDALTAEAEAALEPEVSAGQRQLLREHVRREAVRADSLRELRKELDRQAGGEEQGSSDDPVGESFMEAVATAYEPPWQLGLQHWLDAVAPGPRSFARASRRGADRDDVVLPGRKREGWTLHVVLDTSGSMTETLPHILGLITSFCEGAGVTDVHVVQCDVGVTSDDWVDVSALGRFQVAGFGGSDMSPGMERLAQDPEVAAVLVLTDGYIAYPAAEPPYAVLWGLVDGTESFRPPYGTVVHVRT